MIEYSKWCAWLCLCAKHKALRSAVLVNFEAQMILLAAKLTDARQPTKEPGQSNS
jgi:hypothetical protein